MSQQKDHDLLIEINANVRDIKKSYATRDDIVNAINVHRLDDHKRSIPPAGPGKLHINKERIIWILATAVAAAIVSGMQLY